MAFKIVENAVFANVVVNRTVHLVKTVVCEGPSFAGILIFTLFSSVRFETCFMGAHPSLVIDGN